MYAVSGWLQKCLPVDVPVTSDSRRVLPQNEHAGALPATCSAGATNATCAAGCGSLHRTSKGKGREATPCASRIVSTPSYSRPSITRAPKSKLALPWKLNSFPRSNPSYPESNGTSPAVRCTPPKFNVNLTCSVTLSTLLRPRIRRTLLAVRSGRCIVLESLRRNCAPSELPRMLVPPPVSPTLYSASTSYSQLLPTIVNP